MADRVSPHSLEAEQATLGTILLRPEAWERVAPVVSAVDFFRAAHATIFRSMARLRERGIAIDLITVKDDLRLRGELDDVGGPAYIASLVDGRIATVRAEDYAALVREKARLRALAAAGRSLEDAVHDDDAPAARIAEIAVRAIAAVSVDTSSKRMVSADTAVSEYVIGLDAGTVMAPIPTGYRDLDAVIGGFRRKELAIVAARPSVGKSSLLLRAAVQIARTSGPVGYFSPEMTVESLAGKMIGWESRVPSAIVERREASQAQYAAVGEASSRFGDVPLYLNDSAHSFVEVEAWTRRLIQEHGILGVFVDYLQLLTPGGTERRMERNEQVAWISGSLKRMAKDLGIFVAAASQLSRGPDDRRDKRPQLSDLRESGALEQDADTAILLYRPEMHKRDDASLHGIAEVIVAKQRNGPVDIVRMAFIRDLTEFRDLAPGWQS